MKKQPLISIRLVSVFAVTLSTFALAQTGNEIVQGRLKQIKNQQLTIEVVKGEFREFKFDPKKALCFDFRGDKTTCETLISVGYADKARITLVNGVIQRVDILELQQ